MMADLSPIPGMISKDEVLHIASLCHIGLTEMEVEQMRQDLTTLLSEVAILQSIDTTEVNPNGYLLDDSRNRMRTDEPKSSLPLADVLFNAPRRDQDYFRVAAVQDEGMSGS
jgi:aspartyl-tRNA(Asn)/glutamyl-tRNA(Gln) amidotransferase subunit C